MSETLTLLNGQTGRLYRPETLLISQGISIVRTWLRDTWAAWCPERRRIVIASGLTAVQERCILAHEWEHVAAGDIDCSGRPLAVRQELRADVRAARKLIAISDLAEVARWTDDLHTAAVELDVTERLLKVRLDDLQGEGWPWPDGSKIAG